MSSSIRLSAPRRLFVSLDEEAAGVLGQPRQTRLGVEAEEVFRPLDEPHDRLIGVVAGRGELAQALLGRLLDLAPRLERAADRAQAAGVHRVDGDVGAVGRFDDRLEIGLQRRRGRQPLGEEDERLAARELDERLQHGEEGVGRGEAALVAIERVEGLEHPQLADGDAPFHLELTDVAGVAGQAGAAADRLLGQRDVGFAVEGVSALPHRHQLLDVGLGARPGRHHAAHRLADKSRILRVGLERGDGGLGREDAHPRLRDAAHRERLEGSALAE